MDLRKFKKLSAADWLIIPQLVLFSIPLRLAVRAVPLTRLAEMLNSYSMNGWVAWFPLAHRSQTREALYLMADRAARVTKGEGRCLIRSLLLFWLLKARRAQAELLIGVNREESQLRAHAWVEAQGQVLGDRTDPAMSFTTLLRV